MPQVPFTSFYLGPLAVYPAKTGLLDPITGAPEKGGNFAVGNYCDLSEADAQVWNSQYSPAVPLHQGRYRIVQLSSISISGYTGFGFPAAWPLGTTVQQVVVAAAGDNYTPGTYILSSTTSGGTAVATAQVVVGGALNGIISATLLNGGAGFTSVPTFSLTALGGGAGGSVVAQMTETANVVNTYDSSAIALASPRGVFLCPVTATQITNGAYVVIQEAGIAPVRVTVNTNSTTSGAFVAATIGAVVTATTAATAVPVGLMGTTLDVASSAPMIVRAILELPIMQG